MTNKEPAADWADSTDWSEWMTFQVHRFTPGITRTPYSQNQSITQERESAFQLHAEHNSALLTSGTPTVTMVPFFF